MPHYQRVGSVPPKRHTDHRSPTGERYAEELMGRRGFSGESSLLYHRHSPSALHSIRAADEATVPSRIEIPLRPHHLRPSQLQPIAPPVPSDPVAGRRILLRNADVRIGWFHANAESPLTRSVVGDELVYVQAGSATLATVFGSIAVGAGDYVVVPSGVTHQWTAVVDLRALVIETTSEVTVPARYLSPEGQFLEHAPYCERDIRLPGPPPHGEGDDVDVLVRSVGGAAWHTHAHHPFDVVG